MTSRDMRIHRDITPESPTPQQWVSELMTGMGPRPIHPDELPLPTICQVSYSDDEDDKEEEAEPKYLRIHCNNPIPDDAPQYKKNKRAHWLPVEKKKHEKSIRDRAVTSYYQSLSAWERQPGKIPKGLETVEIDGYNECDNAFWGMYGPGFLYVVTPAACLSV
ncbi:uncharacterized protein ARMOST_19826 [Armillaria ostoyae]|uniref:Uncharacterized protein n=1 Tax=Armillaria ostoyae TaxID=47428 RepID=A0A284S5R5_ARMOS|nr:uncharacterized protein ARMOST_19826 [Armillaria ostoyae]